MQQLVSDTSTALNIYRPDLVLDTVVLICILRIAKD